ncbi:MAG: ribosome maturation factor RimM [Chloroflexi bacterium]|nr:ribosome maturation factor RimM [Chloroflexota bacterium]
MSVQRSQPKYLLVGVILRPHGVRGELRMRVLTDDPENLTQLDSVYLAESPNDAAPRQYEMKGLRFNKKYVLLHLEGCRSRNDAETLRDKKVLIRNDQAPPLEDGEYYLSELIGLQVVADDMEIGLVKEVLQTGANDVYVVDGVEYGEVLIPAHDETILSIDFDSGVIIMTLPEGLLPPR